MSVNVQGRRALVTGAAGGVGRAIAAHLLEGGASVALSDIRAQACERTATDLAELATSNLGGDGEGSEAATGGGARRLVTAPADLRDRAQGRRCVRQAHDGLGGLDVLVNAAGLYPSRPAVEMSDSEWDDVMRVNLDAPFALATELARLLIAAGQPGHIVNVASTAAERARRGAAHYCTSKAGLLMTTRALALELAPHHIHVNAVSPGFIEVDSEVNPLRQEYVAAVQGGQPWPRPGTPDDVAAVVCFLCSPDADWMTGATLPVDGGAGAGNARLPLS